MKTTYIILLLALSIFFSCKAQQQVVDIATFNQGDNSNKYFKDINNYFQPFLGTWENTTGNLTFRVILWKEANVDFAADPNCSIDKISGKFYLIENLDLPNETILCQSEKYYPINNATSETVIYSDTKDGIHLGGLIIDNCITHESGFLAGELNMVLLNTIPSTAQWTVSVKGLRLTGQEFRIPTNTILTKQ